MTHPDYPKPVGFRNKPAHVTRKYPVGEAWITQAEIAERIGKSVSYVCNLLKFKTAEQIIKEKG